MWAASSVLAEHLVAAGAQARAEPLEALVGGRDEHLEQVRPRGRHAERVAVEGAEQLHAAVLDEPRELGRHADRSAGQAAAERLGERDHVGLYAEALHGAARGDRQPGLDLVEDQDDPLVCA